MNKKNISQTLKSLGVLINRPICCLLMLAFLSACSAKRLKEQERKTAVSNYNCIYEIAHDGYKMVVDADKGARIIGFYLNGNQVLSPEDKDLPNYGSTFWPAPQAEWGWPPYKTIHEGKYKVKSIKNGINLSSDVDGQSGLKTTKAISFDAVGKAFDIHYAFINKTDTAKKIGPWEVTVIPYKGLTFFRKSENIAPLQKSNLLFKDTLGIEFLNTQQAPLIEIQKLFAFGNGGWLAHINTSRQLFIKKFDNLTKENIAPGQGEIEVYTNKKLAYMELENHGLYRQLKPGAALAYHVKWYIRQLPNNIKDDRITKELINFVEK